MQCHFTQRERNVIFSPLDLFVLCGIAKGGMSFSLGKVSEM